MKKTSWLQKPTVYKGCSRICIGKRVAYGKTSDLRGAISEVCGLLHDQGDPGAGVILVVLAVVAQ